MTVQREIFWENNAEEQRDGFEPMPGDLVHGLPNDRYHALPGASKSQLAKIKESAYQYKNSPFDPTDAQEFGTLAHTLVLEPHRFAEEYAVVPKGMARNKNHAAYQEFLAGAGDKIPIKESDLEDAIPLSQAVLHHPTWSAYEADETCSHMNEVSGWWEDPETGLLCKFRADRLTVPRGQDQPLLCWDLKTFAKVPTFENIQFQGEKYLSFPLGTAFYADGVAALFSRPCDMVLVLVQKKPPFEVGIVSYVLGGIETDLLKYGRMEYQDALTRLKECDQSGHFPPAIEGIESMELSPWATKKLYEHLSEKNISN